MVLERWPSLVVFRLAVVVLLLKAECGQLVFCLARMSLTIMATLLSSAALRMVCRALGVVVLFPQKRLFLFNGQVFELLGFGWNGSRQSAGVGISEFEGMETVVVQVCPHGWYRGRSHRRLEHDETVVEVGTAHADRR